MIQFKILRSSYYEKNLDYSFDRNVKESGDYYINKDIANFYAHNDIDILDINLLSKDGQILVVIKYRENNNGK